MSRKWTNIKFYLEDRTATVIEATSNPRTQEQILNDYSRNQWGEDNVPVTDKIDVMFGSLNKEKRRKIVRKYFNEFEFIHKCAVLSVSDSAHCGHGWVYSSDNSEITCLDTYTGDEGLEGRDVAGHISKDHSIDVSPSWYWSSI